MRSIRIKDYAEATAGTNDSTADANIAFQLRRDNSAVLNTISGFLTGTLVEERKQADFFILQTEDTGIIYLNLAAFSPKGGYQLYQMRPLLIDDPGTLSVSSRTITFTEITHESISLEIELAADSALDATAAVYKLYVSDSIVGVEFDIADGNIHDQGTGTEITDSGVGVFNITDLSAEAFYAGTITTENANGDILKYSYFETITAEENVPPESAPAFINVHDDTASDTLTVEMTEVELGDHPDDERGYKVRIKNISTEVEVTVDVGFIEAVDGVVTAEISKSDNSLTAGANFRIDLKSYNPDGDSIWSAPEYFETKEFTSSITQMDFTTEA